MASLSEFLIGIWQYDLIEDRLSLSREWYEIAKRNVMNPIRTLRQFRNIVHNDDLYLMSDERIASILETGGHKTYVRLVGDDGCISTVLCSASAIESFDQKTPRLTGTMVDATAFLSHDGQVFPGIRSHATLEELLDTMQRVQCAALVINDRAEVLAANEIAKAFLGEGPITLVERRLIATSADSNSRLQAFLSTVCGAPDAPHPERMAPIGFPRTGRRPLVIQAEVVSEHLGRTPLHPKAIIGFADLNASGVPRGDHVRSALGLTIAESRLVLVLMDHFRLRDAARTLGISHETARTQLRHVFLKTGARNQADLLVMLERLGRGSTELLRYMSLLEDRS